MLGTAAALGALPAGAAQAQAVPSPAPTAAVVIVRTPDAGAEEAAFRQSLAQWAVPPPVVSLSWSGRPDEQAALRTRLAALAPALVYTVGARSAAAVGLPAPAASPPVPLVFSGVVEPLAAELRARAAAARRPVAGVLAEPPLAAQWAALRAYRPFRRLMVLQWPAEAADSGSAAAAPGTPWNAAWGAAWADWAQAQGLPLRTLAVPLGRGGEPDAAALTAALRRQAREGIDLVLLGPWSSVPRRWLAAGVQAAHEAGLPTFCAAESAVHDDGCLFGLVADPAGSGRTAARLAWRLWSGEAGAAEPGLESPPRLPLRVHMGSAARLGLYPSMAVLDQAEVVVPGRDGRP